MTFVKFTTFLKSRMTNVDLGMSLFCLKTTSIENELPSPANLLLDYLVKKNLQRTVPSVPTREEVTPGFTEKQQVHKFMKDPQTNLECAHKTEGDRVTKWKPAEIRGKEHDLLAHQNIGYLRCPGPDFLCAFQLVAMIRPVGRIYVLIFFSA